ncbi:MAG: hypothetical protein BroJett042_18630 [Bacteroidota bacterium]|nr:MAG: hypothetical protein UZ12_BCD005000406 [Bacteroidetes bacterium OLB12]GIL23350.1 MAG: hypothetical protein BroJett042_18630 [Bacteroidota bacterium]HNU41410.1 hypothetical protein [Cyclobacteriaceae bacterium]
MNYKPDEGTLMAYLYGELDATETEKVKQYLQQHPEVLQHLQQLGFVRTALGSLSDEEVIAPPVFVDNETKNIPFWKAGYFKVTMGIAASFLFLLIAARLIGPEVMYKNGELRISFNRTPENPATEQSLTANEVQEMINTSLVKNNETIASNWEVSNQKIQESLQRNLNNNSARIDKLISVASQASQDQVRTFVAGMQEENMKLMKDYFQLSAKDQQTYVENLLVDFTKYLHEQRKQDMLLFQTRMNSIEKNTDQFKQETEQILASIISNPEGTIKKVNNY